MMMIGYVFYSQSEIKNISPQPYVTIVNNNISAKGKLLLVKNELLLFKADPSSKTLAKLKMKARVHRASIFQDFEADRTQRIHQQYGNLKKVSQMLLDMEIMFARINSLNVSDDALTQSVLKELDIVYRDLNVYLSRFVSNVQKNQMEFVQYKEDFYDNQSIYLGIILLFSMLMIGVISWMYVNQIRLSQDLHERTERIEEAKKLAEQSATAKARFLANMSHEMRTPLNAVIGLSQKEYFLQCDEQTRQFTSLINSSGQHLLKLINSVLDISKIEQGKIKLEQDTFYCDELLDVSRTIFIEMSKPGVEVYLSSAMDKRYQIVADKTKLLQIVNNLSFNAVKFTSHGFVDIHFDLDAQQQQMIITIKDTGIGMTEEQLENVFKEFTQADDSITRKYGGTGLGLSICQSLVQLMKGTIHVNSQPKLGTTFVVTIPVKVMSEQRLELSADLVEQVRVVAEQSIIKPVVVDELSRFNLYSPNGNVLVYIHSPEDKIDIPQMMNSLPEVKHLIVFADVHAELPDLNGLTRLSKPYDVYTLIDALSHLSSNANEEFRLEESEQDPSFSVLLVEDMKVNQIVAKKMLTTLNAKVEIANDGQECLDALRKEQFALILMDIQMPVMDGMEALKRIRKDNLAPNSAIVALTANTSEKDVLSYLELGFNDVLPKPVRLDLMARLVAKYE